jgi:hypothetical protein
MTKEGRTEINHATLTTLPINSYGVSSERFNGLDPW